MEKFKMVNTDFWRDPVVQEMAWEEKYFYLYLLTNPHATTDGSYQVSIEQISQKTRLSIEEVQALISRFSEHYQLISYNYETCEINVKKQGAYLQD
ncbi:replication protein [Metabacillus litoralis]|uniref:replication protein n=1 Tax=Metabacillus TaxID=2675233 RepID=UPI001B8DC68A|nr:replication protein [Metabacillus litoralis]MCM3409593.1 replication protein [Metabacillus litoralis]UHA58838.1 replication protein [Metabacillus litoralis]